MQFRKVRRVVNSMKVALTGKYLPLYWCNTTSNRGNWGDEVNLYLCEKISGKKIIHTSDLYPLGGKACYTAIGSILDNLNINNISVWGSGFKFENAVFRVPPVRIEAVRGRLSRLKILEMGLECPDVYGDPALLMPRFYNPDVPKKYKLGIIPHLIDQNSMHCKRLANNEQIRIIDVRSGILPFIDAVKSCENIASSSLHGLVVADAYNIPSAWISFSDKILGGDFKFRDYFSSVNREESQALKITDSVSLQQLLDHTNADVIQIDLEKLFSACPFRRR